jgi:FMN phosphatase YigB (HAD superfamily)
MFDTILFDLHGTLLPIDLQRFLQIYFQEMGMYFQDLIDPGLIQKYVMTATNAMLDHPGDQTNETVFMEKFKSLVDQPITVFKQRFDEFYDRGFLKGQKAAAPIPMIPEIIKLLKQKGYQLVVATNPVFPKKAIRHFIQWAGLELGDFSYLSCFEDNHYCKPKPQFFGEILQRIGKVPNQCLMVGNDSQEDLGAESLGIKTYIITDYLIQQTPGEIQCTYQGTYDDLYQFVANLPPVRT